MNLLRTSNPLARVFLFLAMSFSAALTDFYPALLALNALAALLLAAARPRLWLVRLALLVFMSWLPISIILFGLAGYDATGEAVSGLLLGMDWMGIYLLRLLCILLANLFIIASMTSREFIQAMRSLGLPPKLILFATVMLRFLPISLEEARRIVTVQRCRGFRLTRLLNPLNLLPVLTPLFIAHLKRAHETMLCLEVRHFLFSVSRPRAPLHLGTADAALVGLSGLSFIAPFWG